MRIPLIVFLLSSVLGFAADDRVSKITEMLVLTGTDVSFLEYQADVCATMERDGAIPRGGKDLLMKEMTAALYLKEASLCLAEEFMDSEVTVIRYYLLIPENAALFRTLRTAVRTLKGDALRVRYQELAIRDPEVWARAAKFYRSAEAQKLAAALEGEKLKKIRDACGVTEMLRARAIVIARETKN